MTTSQFKEYLQMHYRTKAYENNIDRLDSSWETITKEAILTNIEWDK